ncbi:hypothetical protein D3C80_1029060 [compost metagenome]
MTHVLGDRQDCFLSDKRLAQDAGEEAGGCLVRLSGADADRRQTDADTIEETAPAVIGQQQFAHRLLRAVTGERRQMEIIGDRIGQGRTDDRDRRGEDDARKITVLLVFKPDGIEQIACTVEVDAIALVEIEFRFAGNDRRQMKNDVRPRGDQLLRLAGQAEIRSKCRGLTCKTGRRFRLNHIDQCQRINGLAVQHPFRNETLDELATDHAGSTDNKNMHVSSHTPVDAPRISSCKVV